MRIFDTTAEATAHMTGLEHAVQGCTSYDANGLRLQVTAAPALQIPDEVAVFGWRESSRYSRYYVFDVQRGNVVIRSTLSTDGTVSEQQFRSFVEYEAGLAATFEVR